VKNGRPKKILFICGTLNTTTQMHQIARELPEHEHWFSHYYADGFLEAATHMGWLEASILGQKARRRCLDYLYANGLAVDPRGTRGDYDLVVTTHDCCIPENIRDKTIVQVQEGMTDPEGFFYWAVKLFPSIFPRWWAATSGTGMSNAYDVFCVASEGYKRLFAGKGARPEKMIVTGIPNFDDCERFRRNRFGHHGYVLVCTSDGRETLKWWEDRPSFLRRAVRIARGRPLIFKLHPNEKVERATAEIRRWAPGALIYAQGCAEEMVANCDVLVCQYSSLAFVGLALGKEVHSYFDVDQLQELLPLQNRCAARNIAAVCRSLLGEAPVERPRVAVDPPRIAPAAA
jgi:hypothetical protein